MACDSARRAPAGDASGRAAHGRQGAGLVRLRGSRALRTRVRVSAPVRRTSAWTCAPDRRSPPRREAASRSIARSACTAARASGTAAAPSTPPRGAQTSTSARAPAVCTRSRTERENLTVMAYHIVVCAGIVPDPLQSLEPVMGTAGPGLKNEAMLPAVLDPWAGHALFEAANLAKAHAGSKVWVVSLAPKAKLQQVMMTVAQKVPFELVADRRARRAALPTRSAAAAALAERHRGHSRSRPLAAAVVRRLGIGVARRWRDDADDRRAARHRRSVPGRRRRGGRADGRARDARARSRAAGTRSRVCAGPPAVLGWATGHLREPANNPQVGMANMRTLMPALQKAKAGAGGDGRHVRERGGAVAAARHACGEGPAAGRRSRRKLWSGFSNERSRSGARGSRWLAGAARARSARRRLRTRDRARDADDRRSGGGGRGGCGSPSSAAVAPRASWPSVARPSPSRATSPTRRRPRPLCRAAGADIIVVAGTSRWMRVAAGVAQRLGGRVDTHVTRITAAAGAVSVARWYYRQRIEAVTSRTERPWLMAVEPGAHESWTGHAAAVTVEAVNVVLPEIRTHVAGIRSPASGRADDPARCARSARGRRRLDQEATGRPGARARSRGAHPRVSCAPRRPRSAAASRSSI